MSGYAIEMNGVAKRYGKRCILDGFDLAVPKGAVYALLGNNGAGKSTSDQNSGPDSFSRTPEMISVLGLVPVKRRSLCACGSATLRKRSGFSTSLLRRNFSHS